MDEVKTDAQRYQDTLRHLYRLLAVQRLPKVMLAMEDLSLLVRCALVHDEITLSKGAELLGLTIAEMRALQSVWPTGGGE